jgi:AcrR family transcriptional regulator
VDNRIAERGASPARSGLYGSLLRQARLLFLHQGYRATSTRDIADRAGASEALLFRHFGSKQLLFQQAVLQPFREALDRYLADRPDDGTDGPEDGIGAEVGRLFGFMVEHRALFRALIATSGIQDGPAAELTERGSPLGEVFDRLRRHLEASIPAAGRTLDLPVTARAVVGLVTASAVLDDWLFEGLDTVPSADRVTAELTSLIRHGCTGRPSTTPSTPPRAVPLPPLEPPADTRDGPLPRERTKNRQRRSRHDVRRAVLAAARELFSTRGYAGTTTQGIATLAQVSETSVYRHYTSKRNLFERAIFEPFQHWVTTYLASWERTNRSPTSLERQSRSYVGDTYDLLAGSRGLIRSLIATSALEVEGSPGVDRDSPLREIFPRLEDQLAGLAEENGLMGLDVEITIRSSFGMVLALATLPDWMFDGPRSTPSRARLVNEMAALMTFGTTTRSTGGS